MNILATILKPVTSPEKSGVATRDLIMVVSAIIAVLGVLGFLTPEQQAELTRQAPVLMAALGTVGTVGMSLYRIFAKSMSAKAEETAKVIDKTMPKEKDVAVAPVASNQPIEAAIVDEAVRVRASKK